jgi:thiol-disulfide isomerase/thioredoxin
MSENKEEAIKAQIKSLIKGDSRDNTEETKKVEQKEKDNKENTKESKENNDKILVLLYANWCGHCRDFYVKDNKGNPLEFSEIDKNKVSWQKVKKECDIKTLQFEESELKNGGKVDGVDLKDLHEYVNSWPTIVMLEKQGDKYKILKQFKGSRNNIKDIKEFITECTEPFKIKQDGGSVNYRHKYKKYKVMYRDLLTKYKQIGGK